MAIRFLRYEGDPILRQVRLPVRQVDSSIQKILQDIADTLYNTPNGAGLSANQVGILKRLIVVDTGTGLLQLANPVVIDSRGEQECVEGCLSIPGRYGKTRRPQRVVVQALDARGKSIFIPGEGELAKCLCHEIDHLDGILFTDRVFAWL